MNEQEFLVFPANWFQLSCQLKNFAIQCVKLNHSYKSAQD